MAFFFSAKFSMRQVGTIWSELSSCELSLTKRPLFVTMSLVVVVVVVVVVVGVGGGVVVCDTVVATTLLSRQMSLGRTRTTLALTTLALTTLLQLLMLLLSLSLLTMATHLTELVPLLEE
jgi:hypothetical protein